MVDGNAGRETDGTDRKSEQEEVARRLRSARETLGLTQEDVASALGIPRTSMIAMEAGRRNVTALEIRRLARIYRREVAWILGEVPETINGQAPENEALFRATASLSDADKEQVLRFAQFLAAADVPAGSLSKAASLPPLRKDVHSSAPDRGTDG